LLLQYAEENVKSAEIALSEEDKDAMRKIAEEAVKVPGNRYGAGMMELCLLDTPPLKK
jgi:hypothetical protein